MKTVTLNRKLLTIAVSHTIRDTKQPAEIRVQSPATAAGITGNEHLLPNPRSLCNYKMMLMPYEVHQRLNDLVSKLKLDALCGEPPQLDLPLVKSSTRPPDFVFDSLALYNPFSK